MGKTAFCSMFTWHNAAVTVVKDLVGRPSLLGSRLPLCLTVKDIRGLRPRPSWARVLYVVIPGYCDACRFPMCGCAYTIPTPCFDMSRLGYAHVTTMTTASNVRIFVSEDGLKHWPISEMLPTTGVAYMQLICSAPSWGFTSHSDQRYPAELLRRVM